MSGCAKKSSVPYTLEPGSKMHVYIPNRNHTRLQSVFIGILHVNYDILQYTPISKNVVEENGEWQLSNGNCTTERNYGSMSSSRDAKPGSLSNHDGNKNPTDLHL